MLFSIYFGLTIFYCIGKGFIPYSIFGLSSRSKNYNIGIGDSLIGDVVPKKSSVCIRSKANLTKELQFSAAITINNH